MRVIHRIPSCIKYLVAFAYMRPLRHNGTEYRVYAGAIRRVCAWQYNICGVSTAPLVKRFDRVLFYSGQGEGQRRRDDRSLQGHTR